ncbi:MAG: hypothetical protein ACJAU1_001722 [Psychromonas sp.]
MNHLIVVARFSFPLEAQIAKGLLESEEIPVFIADEHTINMQWLYSDAMGGVRLLTPFEFADRAQHLLSKDFSENIEDELQASHEKCPECASEYIEPYTKGKRAAFVVFILLGFPLFFYKHGLRCKNCGCFWRT